MSGKAVSLSAALLFVWLTGPVLAQHCKGKEGKAAAKQEHECVKGQLKSVDAKESKVVVTVGEGEAAKDVTLSVCPKAKIVINGEEKTLADVKAGEQVCLCVMKNAKGEQIARRVMVGKCEKVEAGTCGKGEGCCGM
jgi:hypothetical protein